MPGVQGQSPRIDLCCQFRPGRVLFVQTLVKALVVVETEPAADAGPRIGHAIVLAQIDLLIFQRVHSRSIKMLSRQRPRPSMLMADAALGQDAGEFVGGELRALIAVEDLGPAPIQRTPQRLDTAINLYGQRQRPAQHKAAEPVHDRDQVDEPLGRSPAIFHTSGLCSTARKLTFWRPQERPTHAWAALPRKRPCLCRCQVLKTILDSISVTKTEDREYWHIVI